MNHPDVAVENGCGEIMNEALVALKTQMLDFSILIFKRPRGCQGQQLKRFSQKCGQ